MSEIKERSFMVRNYSDAARKRAAAILEEIAWLIRSGAEVKEGGIYIGEWKDRSFKVEVDISFLFEGEK